MGGTDTATIHLSVFNLPPQLEDDINNTSLNQSVDGNVLTNDLSDPNDALAIGDGAGNLITAAITMTTDQGGTLVINPDGTYTYTPPAGFIGEDSVTIEICDSFGACVDSTLTIEIIDSTASQDNTCLLYTSPSPRDRTRSRMPSSA